MLASQSPLTPRGVGLLLSPLVVAAATVTAACVAGPVADQARLGNVFFEGDLVQIPVAGEGPVIPWRLIDFFGAEVARGTAPVTAAQALIEPHLAAPGYFEVAFQPAPGAEEERRAFAIIAPPAPDNTPATSRFGVMTHFAQDWERDVLPLIAAAGIRHIRDEQYWSEVEPEAGSFVFPESYTAYMAEAADQGLEPLIVMSFDNPLYDEGQTPYTAEGRAAYGRYGRAILEQYGPQIGTLEIWNEYNGSFAHGPAAEDRVASYTAMLKEVYGQIKEARPDVQVLGGAAVTVPLPWMEAIFAQGALEAMDGVVVHPYRTQPEGVEREIGALQGLIQTYNGGVPKPIWVTEFGHQDNSEPGRRRSAEYLVEMSTLLLGAGVERLYWYLLRDYQTEWSDFESMGLLRDTGSPFGRYAPAPAYVAYATLIRELQGATYIRREPTDPRTEVHLFEKHGQEIRVVWSTTDAPLLQLATSGDLTLVDLMGRERTLSPTPDGVSLLISGTPVYLKGPVDAVHDWRPDVLVADSDLDFSPQDHASGWQYGAYDGDGEGSGDGAAPDGPYSDDDFELLSPASDLWRRHWADPQLGPVSLDGGGGHPGLVGEEPVWAVRRWISPFDGTLRIRGEIGPPNGGDGTQALILNDGVAVFSQALAGASGDAPVSYDIKVEVRRGGALDFAITPGPGHDIDYDATAFSAAITLPLLADSVRDFSLVQGEHGWFYGFADSAAKDADAAADAAFTPFPPGDAWGGGQFGYLAIDPRGAHPAQHDGQPVRAVRRWRSDAQGPVRIRGEVAIWDNAGDGVRAWVLVDGEPVLALELGGPDGPDRTTYDVTATLHPGSLVDFALDPGLNGNINFDGSTFTAVIQKL